MKKLLLTIFIVLLASSLFAANIDYSTLTTNPTQTELDDFYKDNSKPVVVPILLNSIVGFGLGSATVGDAAGFTTGLVLDSVAFTAIIGGWGMLMIDMMIQSQTEGLGGVADPNSEVKQIGETLTYSGLATLLVSRIVQSTMVGLYSSNYNKELKSNLEVIPVVELTSSNGLYLGTSIKF